MDLSERIVEGVIKFLVVTLLRPKVYFENEEEPWDKLPEPRVLIVNHTSHLDGVVLGTVFSKNHMHSLAAKDRFEQKTFGFFLRNTGCIPIDRNNPDLSWVHQSMDYLHNKHENIVIFPEGRHGKHREQLPFHPGVVMLAALAQVPLVMVYIDGPHYLARKRSRLIVSKEFTLAPPTNGLNSEYINEQTVFLQNKMKDLMNLFIDKYSVPE